MAALGIPAFAFASGPEVSTGRVAEPSFPAVTLQDGSRYQVPAGHDRITVVNFWASWCGPCRRELPSLDRLAARRRDVEVVAVSVDSDPADGMAAFVGRYPHLRLAFAKPAAVAAYGALGLPYSVVFDRRGREIARVPRAVDWDRTQPEAPGRR